MGNTVNSSSNNGNCIVGFEKKRGHKEMTIHLASPRGQQNERLTPEYTNEQMSASGVGEMYVIRH